MIWNFLKQICREHIPPTVKSIIFNTVLAKKTHIVNFLVLLFKFSIFQQKCLDTKPTVAYIKKEIIFYYNLELSKCVTNKDKLKIKRRWQPVLLNQLM